MRSVPLHLVNPLKAGRRISAKLEPRFEGAVAWVSVTPFKKDLADAKPGKSPEVPWMYRVRDFEVPQWMMDQELDVGNEAFHRNEQYVVHTLAEVDDLPNGSSATRASSS